MKRLISNALVLSAVLFLPSIIFGQTAPAAPGAAAPKSREEVNKVRAEVDAGSRHYREGNFEKAEAHFRKALELDPEHRTAPLFLARSIQEQVRAGDASPENAAKVEAAVEAYRRILTKNPDNEDAFNSIVMLYRATGNPEKGREFILERASDASVLPAKRTALYARLAAEDWQCSSGITESKENKETSQQAEKTVVTYKMPADNSEFYKARQCVQRGLEAVEQALLIAPRDANAWSQKSNLLRENVKLAEMEGDAYQKEAAEAQLKEAMAELQGLMGAANSVAAGVQKPATSDKAPVRGGVLNSKAVSKPAPVYPQEAKEAGAQGTVTVQVVVDENGSVISAEAVNGPALLREPAVNAAKQARFSPTTLSGQPVKVTGLITYNFVLQ